MSNYSTPRGGYNQRQLNTYNSYADSGYSNQQYNNCGNYNNYSYQNYPSYENNYPVSNNGYNQPRRMKASKGNSSNATRIIFIINMIAFAICAVYLGNYVFNSINVQGKQEDLTNLIDGVAGSGEDRYESIRDEYPHLVGRLLFHNYNDVIDLPVMQTKDDPMYYLYRDQDGKDSNWGTPFLDYRCDVGKPTDNFVVYAHNMKDMTQFGSLKNYKTETYWKQYKTVEFETMYEERMEYEVVASFYSQIYDAETTGVFKYYKFFDAESESDYNDFVNGILGLSNYNTGIVPKYGDQLLTLSTCDYTQDVEEGRFVVVCRKVGASSEQGSVDEFVDSIESTTEPVATKKPSVTSTPVATKKPENVQRTSAPVQTETPNNDNNSNNNDNNSNNDYNEDNNRPQRTFIPGFIDDWIDQNTDSDESTENEEPQSTSNPWWDYWNQNSW